MATAQLHSFDIMSAAPSETACGGAHCTQNNHFCTSTFRRDSAQISSTGGLRLYSAQPYLQVYALHFKLLLHTPLHTQIYYKPPPTARPNGLWTNHFFDLAGRRGRPRGPMGEWDSIPGLYVNTARCCGFKVGVFGGSRVRARLPGAMAFGMCALAYALAFPLSRVV